MEMPENYTRGESGGAKEVAAFGWRDFVLFGLLAALFLGVRLRRLDASCLWFDEIFGVHAAAHSWRELLNFAALDLIHPPLFYLLLKVWIALGGGSEAIWWLRLFPVLMATAGLVFVLLLGRELRLRPMVWRLALLLMCINGFLIQYAREVRMYGLLFLLAAWSLWLFARFAQAERLKQKDGLALFAVNLALVYTHYYGWLLVGHELLFLVVWQRQRVKRFALMLAALVVCYSPWVWMLWRAAAGGGEGGGTGEGLLAQNIGWAVAPRMTDILHPFLLLHEPFRFRQNTLEPIVLRVNVWLALIVFLPPLVALGWRLMQTSRRWTMARNFEAGAATLETDGQEAGRSGMKQNFAFTFLIFFSTAPVVVAFLLARVLPHSIWGTRHLIIIAPVYLLLAAAALVALRPFWLATTCKLLLACWLAVAAMLWFMRHNDAPPIWCAWGTLAGQVAQTENSGGEEIQVYAFEDLSAYHLWYALNSLDGARKFHLTTVVGLPGLLEDKAFFLPRGFAEVTHRQIDAAMHEEYFWVAFRVGGASGNTGATAAHPVLRLLSERGYKIERQFEVTASGQKALMFSVRRLWR